MNTPKINRFQSPVSRSSSHSSIAPRTIAFIFIAAVGVLVPGSRAWAIDATVWAELAKTKELSATFTQVQYRAVLKKPLTSTGEVRFSRPQDLSWVVETPSKSSFTLKNSIATMSYPDLGMNEVIDLASVPDAGRLATSLLVWMQADAAAVDRDFTVTYSASGAHLVPKDPQLAKLLSSIDLTMAPSPWRVTSVSLHEPAGDHVDLTFANVVLK